MAERKNTGLAVSDAKRLNDCFNELGEAIAARPPMKGDRELWQYDYAALPGGPEGEERAAWNHRCGSKDIALIALRGAVVNDNLQLWTNGPHGEAKIDRYELKEPTFKTFASGTYQPDNRRLDTAGLADSPLWVKEADWRQYMSELWAVRYGIDWANPAPPADEPLLPPDGQFVTLSHALTWIAFGVSMDNDHLHEVLAQDRYGEHDPQQAIADALEQLLALAGNERMSVRGKYRANRDDDAARLDTAPIEPIKFADFRRFSYLENELRHGNGLLSWRDESGQIFHDTFGSKRKDCFTHVTVNRADLLREFRPQKNHVSESDHFCGRQSFSRDDPANIAPWWSINQALAWIATRIPSYAEYIGNLETDEPGEHRPYIVQAICESQVAESDEGKAFMESCRTSWPDGTFLAHAGRELLSKILAGEVRPMIRQNGQGRQMRNGEFVGIGARATGGDWLDLDPQPVFSSQEVLKAFPMEIRSSAVQVTAETPAELPVWLNPYQLEAWVQYRDLSIVAKAGGWNGLAAQRMYGDDAPTVGNIGELIEALQDGHIPAQGQKNGETFQPIAPVEWTRIALAPLDLSRQHPYVRIQFNRRDVLALFPAIGDQGTGDASSKRATISDRKKPGPAPDPDWPDAISKVTADCLAAGYTKSLKRGDKAAIQSLLLSAMAEKDKHPSDDTARKYAEKVIAELPDNST